MKFTYKITESSQLPPSSFTRKWRVNGTTEDGGGAFIGVEVTKGPSADPNTVRAAFAHEVGHATIIAQDIILDGFGCEVTAWTAGVAKSGPLLTLDQGKLALDALNTYRRSLGVNPVEWKWARREIELICTDPDSLRDYTPLEPDSDDRNQQPCSHGNGTGGRRAGGQGGKGSGQEVKAEGEGKAEDGGSGGREPEGKSDQEREIRDAWLLSDDGVSVTKLGRTQLGFRLRDRGWPTDNLPPLTEAILSMAPRQ